MYEYLLYGLGKGGIGRMYEYLLRAEKLPALVGADGSVPVTVWRSGDEMGCGNLRHFIRGKSSLEWFVLRGVSGGPRVQ